MSTLKETIVTVHGMGRLRWSMAHIPLLAKKRGFDGINFEYRSRVGSIRELAGNLRAFLLDKAAPGTTLHFVTHSLGSIIVRELVAHYPNDFNYGRAVMMGPPHQGSEIARKLLPLPGITRYFGAPFQELCNGGFSPLSDRLQVGILAGVLSSTYALVPWFSEPNDGLVRVSETYLDGMRDHRILWCPHAVLMYSPAALRETFYFLQHGTFTDPGRGKTSQIIPQG